MESHLDILHERVLSEEDVVFFVVWET